MSFSLTWIGYGFKLPSNKDLNGQGGRVQTDGVFQIHGQIFVGEFLEDAWPPASSQHYPFGKRGRNCGSQDASGTHERVCVGQQRNNLYIDPF